MRWEGQALRAREADALPGLGSLSNLVRTVRTPEFAGVTFHEVLAKTALNRVPANSRVLGGEWTINPYRGCTHACRYCYARSTHRYLDLNTGEDFDSQIVVKTNIASLLAKELRTTAPARVALGTNTDPYQRAEGKYQLMPGIIGALVERAVPFSILTKGTLLRRDLDVLAAAAEVVDVHLALSIAIFDEELQQSIEPGTPTTAARLATVRAIRERGMECTVLFAPILPFLTDDDEHLDMALTELKTAGVTNVLHTLLYLREGVKPWFMSWVADAHPELVADYEDLFGAGANARPGYRKQLNERVTKLLRKHGYRRETDPGRGRRAAAKLALDRRGSVARPAASEPTLF